MAFFAKKKKGDADTTSEQDVAETPTSNSPIAITATKTPPPCYSTTESPSPTEISTSRTETLDTTISKVWSPDEFKGASRQPTISGEQIIVARHQAPPVNDGNLPEVVVAGSGDGNTARSITSDSRTSLRSPSVMLHSDSTVTPLHLLGDQSDMVDCPFCRRRVETRVERNPSAATQ